MFSCLFKYLLAATSIIPTCLTLAFMSFLTGNYPYFCAMILLSSFLCLLFYFVYKGIDKTQSTTTINIRSLKPANQEVTNYFIAYLFPIIGSDILIQSIPTTIFFLISLFFYIGFSSSYNFNPMLSIFKLNFYEITDGRSITCVLLTKGKIINGNIDKLHVIQITPYMFYSKGNRNE